jgi:hypothetical protein
MGKVTVFRVALPGLLALSVSCNDMKPGSPLTPTAVTPPAPPTPVQTPFAGPGTYEFVASLPGQPVEPYTSGSRYVLRDNGTFTLHTAGWQLREGHVPPHAYEGRYREADGVVTFDFDWNNTRAGAKGVFSGDAMTVNFTFEMTMGGFENGVYVKRP